MTDWTQEAMDQAKQLAPWRSNLPWWIALVEGIVLAIAGILVLINPSQASVNVALFLTIVLLIAGLLQLWSSIRDRVPKSVQAVVAARGAVAIVTGINIWLLYFMGILTPEVGRVLFGLGSLLYGLLGFYVGFGTQKAQRRTALIESVFYTLVGLLVVYVQIAGSTGVVAATRIVGVLALLAGLALIGLAILRQRRGADSTPKAEAAQDEGKVDRAMPADADPPEAEPTEPGSKSSQPETEAGTAPTDDPADSPPST